MATHSGSRILVVDDDEALAQGFRYCLEDDGHAVACAGGLDEAGQLLGAQVFDLCFLDLNLGRASGLDFLPRAKVEAPWMRVVMITGVNRVDAAVTAMQRGAVDYIVKPCSGELLLQTAARHGRARRLELEMAELQGAVRDAGEQPPLAALTSPDPAMQALLAAARAAAADDAPLLLCGEPGTGKRLLARAIHTLGPRRDAPFVAVNCAALNPELLESELFGHRRGAFTGATESRLGRVPSAHRGTLLLDEVGGLPPALQPKLLRLLAQREYLRMGDDVAQPADVRVLATSDRDLPALVAEGSLLGELHARLAINALAMPPLRARPLEIPALATAFLRHFALRYRRPARRLADGAIAALATYAWPGNIRELRNLMERAALVAPKATVTLAQLALPAGAARAAADVAEGEALGAGDDCTLAALERAHIEATLLRTGSAAAAARQLGIDAATLRRKRRAYLH